MKNEAKVIPMIQSVIASMEARGYEKSTLIAYQNMYSRLERYCESINVDEYSATIGQQFIEFVQLHNPSMGDVIFRHYKSIILRMDCLLSSTEWEPQWYKKHAYAKSCYDSVIHEYKDYLVRAGKSIKHAHRLVQMAAKFLAMIEQLGCSQIELISAEMIFAGFKQATDKDTFRSTIGAFFQYAYNRGMTELNLRYLIPMVVRHHAVPSVYSPEEVEQLLASVDRKTKIGKRNFAIILIAARLGLRASDIANLRFDNLNAGNIEIVQVKTKQPLTTTMLSEVKDAIQDYVDYGRPQSSDPHIFLNDGGYGVITANNISNLTRCAFMHSGIDCGIRKMGPHSLRASLATALLSEGNGYSTVQKVLGQINIQSTKSYAKAGIEQLRIHAIPVPPPSGNLAALLKAEVCR